MNPQTIEKLQTVDNLAKIVQDHKNNGKKIAHCHGVFDLIHPGHIRHFEAAKKIGDIIIVTVTNDKFVNKGPGRPYFNERLRAESLAALQAVDYVAISAWPTAVELIKKIKPDFFVKGSEYTKTKNDLTGKIVDEKKAIDSVGGHFRFTDEETYSSTRLLNTFFPVFSPRVAKYLRQFQDKFTANDVIEKIQSLDSLRVLILGDIIIDEYHYCKAIGKSSKSATLTAKFLSSERQAGGVLAVANHIANFTKDVDLITFIENSSEDEKFIRKQLKSNVNPYLIPESGRKNIVKRRYVDSFQVNKMFEVMWLNGNEPENVAENNLINTLSENITNYDAVIVADFGHGTIGQRTIDWLAQQPIFLAINAQTNSANTGYNLVTKYPRANYVCIDEEEMRLANHSAKKDLKILTKNISKGLMCKTISVTRGNNDTITYTESEGTKTTPVLSTDVVDSVGAGDAYFALTSLCAKAGVDPELIGFIGNCTGALAVKIVGNRESVESIPLFKFISTLLK